MLKCMPLLVVGFFSYVCFVFGCLGLFYVLCFFFVIVDGVLFIVPMGVFFFLCFEGVCFLVFVGFCCCFFVLVEEGVCLLVYCMALYMSLHINLCC